MSGRHLPANHSKGDEKTLGGYMAVHDRPAAFEGSDGLSYSVSIETEVTGSSADPWGAFLLFVRWGRGEPTVTGHLETGFLFTGTTEEEVRQRVGALLLGDVKTLLDALISEGTPSPSRPWWEAMNSEQ